MPGGWQARPGDAHVGPASSRFGSMCFLSLAGPCCSNANANRRALVNGSCQIANHPNTNDLRRTKSLLSPPACAVGLREGQSRALSQAFHRMDPCITTWPHPALGHGCFPSGMQMWCTGSKTQEEHLAVLLCCH